MGECVWALKWAPCADPALLKPQDRFALPSATAIALSLAVRFRAGLVGRDHLLGDLLGCQVTLLSPRRRGSSTVSITA